ncbi:hypothetical protein GFD17_09255 [Bifidobacterium sp. SMB2]|uniref:SWIM-type domain-containing protein n=1 Tax=Bifidobacterium saimiriisciurei TaxID=2661627 RepID=A0ABX0CA11_9BIFI|nr:MULTISPECIES: hypothetical protein [Bifidobacterium]NEG96934.1 hypothetical protein [Bifidobacterium sp. SMB2]NEH11536.1 hypothetical protein [Bifidobacterium saimiriisciurei]
MTVPSKPLLYEFETMFDDAPHILERALGYWEDDHVGPVEEIAPALFHAHVAGSEETPYDVDIRLDGGGTGNDTSHPCERHVMSAACTCLYHRTPYCKHVGAVLYALRARLEGDGRRPTTPDDEIADRNRKTTVPKYILDGICRRIDERVRQSDGRDVLFFWSTECLRQAERLRSGAEEPLIPAKEAGRMILGPMDEYHRRHNLSDHDHGPGGLGEGTEPPSWPASGETHRQGAYDGALSGLRTVVDNALHSTDYDDACLNLALCMQALAAFTNSVDDDYHELSNENDQLADRIRCYMENVAAYADSATAGIALGHIAKVAYEPEIQFYDPANAAMLLASACAFARYEDRTMWAYDVIDTALERFGPSHDDELSHDMLVAPRHVLYRYVLMVAYDLRRLAGDEEGCRELWGTRPSSGPLLLMHAVVLIRQRRFREAYRLVSGHLDQCMDQIDADRQIVHNGLLQGLLPHGWHSLLECCAEGMDDADALAVVYRFVIVNGNDRADATYVGRLRRLIRLGGADDEQWSEAARSLARECARNIAERIRTQPEIPWDAIGPERRSSWRNPAYERLIVDERLSDAALTYCVTIDYPPLPLLKTMAIDHPQEARQVIYDALPTGALDANVVVPGTGRRGMDAHRTKYRQVAKQLRRYREVFGEEEMRGLARRIVEQYPNRKALRDELSFAL